MPIIGNVGRKQFRVRLLNASIHIVLLIGAVTMIYPFMIMVSGSFKSAVDSKSFSVYPKYFFDEGVLFKKYVEARYNEQSGKLGESYRDRFTGFDEVVMPKDTSRVVYSDWISFLGQTKKSHTTYDYYLSEQEALGVAPRNQRVFYNKIKKLFDGDINKFNEEYKMEYAEWGQILVSEREIEERKFVANSGKLGLKYQQFKKEIPLWHRYYATFDGKFIEYALKQKFKGSLLKLNEELGTTYPTWNHIILSEEEPTGPLKDLWDEFVTKTLSIHHIVVKPQAVGLYRKFLRDKYETVSFLNKVYKTQYSDFGSIGLLRDVPADGAEYVDWSQFIENVVPPKYLKVKTVELEYRKWLKRKYKDINVLNNIYGKGVASISEVSLPVEIPLVNVVKQKDWLSFVRQEKNLSAIGLKAISRDDFVFYLSKKFPGNNEGVNLKAMNAELGTNFKNIINLYPSASLPENNRYAEIWKDFVLNVVDGKYLTIDKVKEADWQKYLVDKYKSVSVLNDKWGLLYKSFKDVTVDNWSNDYFIFKEHKSDIFWEFVKRNYVMVLDVMLYNGRAIINTLIYCLLAILVALLINPLAAYAMSRFKLPSTYKIILIFMLTMAFPPMVMGIPSFVLIKKMGLLNTFWALVLPAAANGYFIFLLKGFFDSLPDELFEAATIDGATEWQIFWKVAMSLSKPIMAVIALDAFNVSYRNFMMAFILCQDSSMWTLMVHIYQLMQRSSAGVGFASLVIAAVPTFLVFVFAQNIIIKGIVVPTEK